MTYLMMALQVCVNAVAVVPAAHRGPEDWLGLALYPRAAMLNHACKPNVAASFAGLQLRLHALTALAPSAILRLSYGSQVFLLKAFCVNLRHPQLHRCRELSLHGSWAPDIKHALDALAFPWYTRYLANAWT